MNRLLKDRLEEICQHYEQGFIYSDPIEIVHRFSAPEDIEVAGLIASALAYGRVESIKRAILWVMDRMDWKPYSFTMGFDPKLQNPFEGFTYRFNDGRDVAALVYLMRQMIERSGSIEGFFVEDYTEGEPIRVALASFTERVLALELSSIYGTGVDTRRVGVRFFFPSPKQGSACKRLNLYLRWMVRRSPPDFGLWKRVRPADLVIPLDTHMARIARLIGLTARKSADWNMAEEITQRLKGLDPDDPVKYDFAITRLGILGECSKGCNRCRIRDICAAAKPE